MCESLFELKLIKTSITLNNKFTLIIDSWKITIKAYTAHFEVNFIIIFPLKSVPFTVYTQLRQCLS